MCSMKGFKIMSNKDIISTPFGYILDLKDKRFFDSVGVPLPSKLNSDSPAMLQFIQIHTVYCSLPL